MANVIQSFSIPDGSKAHEWLRGCQERGENVSERVRQLIEREGDLHLRFEAVWINRAHLRARMKWMLHNCRECARNYEAVEEDGLHYDAMPLFIRKSFDDEVGEMGK